MTVPLPDGKRTCWECGKVLEKSMTIVFKKQTIGAFCCPRCVNSFMNQLCSCKKFEMMESFKILSTGVAK